MPIGDVSLFVNVVERGYPPALMHGGPGGSLDDGAFRRCADQFALIFFYDHRGNGNSVISPVSHQGWPPGRRALGGG
jgi:hypothetical protein